MRDNRFSVFNDIAILRGCTKEEVVESEHALLCADSAEASLRVREYADAREGIGALPPLVWGWPSRFLLLEGKDKSLFVMSNDQFGTGSGLVASIGRRLKCDWALGFTHLVRELFLRNGDPSIRESKLEFYFLVEVGTRGEIIRRIACSPLVDEYYCVDYGDLLPFEDRSDYAKLETGVLPPPDIYRRLSEWFGWPSPRSRDFLNFVVSTTFVERQGVSSRTLKAELETELMSPPAAWGADSGVASQLPAVPWWSRVFKGKE